MQFRGEKQALREERGDTAAFFFLLSRVVSPLTDGDHKSDRGEIAGKNYQAGETLDTRTRSNRVTGGIRRGKEEKRKEWERSLSRRGGKYSKTRRVRNARLLPMVRGINIVCPFLGGFNSHYYE